MKITKEKIIMGAMILVIIILLGIVFTPKLTNAYRTEGYQICQQDMLNTIILSLNQNGYVPLQLNNQTYKLGIINE